jgi:hypothetical protein
METFNLTKQELENIVGGVGNVSNRKDIANTNNSHTCICDYVNKGATSNINNVDSCKCQCIGPLL